MKAGKMSEIKCLTVRQLIEQLQQFADDLPVLVQSYEEGYDPVTHLDELNVNRTYNRQWYVGIYEPATGQGERALLIASKYNRAEIDDESDDA